MNMWTDGTNVVAESDPYVGPDGTVYPPNCQKDQIPGLKVFVEPPAEPPTPEQIAAAVAMKTDALWRAADAYTSGYISGVAIGLLTLGVLQAKPKALAVTAWSSSVWDEYYARKALITATSTDNLDFSMFGPMPYSVPELREELGM